MRVRDERLVDIIDVLPQIFRSREPERGGGIDVSRHLQHATPDGRKYFLHCLHDAVIERMHGALRLRLANGSDYVRLDVTSFDFNEHCSARADRVERLGQRRNPNSRTDLVMTQSIVLSGRDGDFLARRHTFRMKDRVVMDNYNPVARPMDVELYAFRAEGERRFERGDRVFGEAVVRAAVSNSERGRAALGQRGSLE